MANSFTQDQLPDAKFDYILSNPPFGVEWKKAEKVIKHEHEKLGHAGRFGAGLPRISDGSLLFLQHMASKMKNTAEGTRLAIVFNGSPLFSGAAGSGESEIRRWLLERDMLEGIVALPDQLFYNTGITTYIWIVTNRKAAERKGQVQLLNAVSFSQKMPRSLGSKRNVIAEDQLAAITDRTGPSGQPTPEQAGPAKHPRKLQIRFRRQLLAAGAGAPRPERGDVQPPLRR